MEKVPVFLLSLKIDQLSSIPTCPQACFRNVTQCRSRHKSSRDMERWWRKKRRRWGGRERMGKE